MSLNSLIKINGQLITEHGRKYSSLSSFDNIDFELASGNKKRYYKDVDKVFQFSWLYLPDRADMSVDGRMARDYLISIVELGQYALLEIQEDRNAEWQSYNCLILEYNETLLKHVLQSQCKYFDVTLSMESI